jgi:hypothetical protein
LISSWLKDKTSFKGVLILINLICKILTL